MKAFSAEDYLEDDCGEGFGLWPGLTSSLQAIPIHHDPDSRAVFSPAATPSRRCQPHTSSTFSNVATGGSQQSLAMRCSTTAAAVIVTL